MAAVAIVSTNVYNWLVVFCTVPTRISRKQSFKVEVDYYLNKGEHFSLNTSAVCTVTRANEDVLGFIWLETQPSLGMSWALLGYK